MAGERTIRIEGLRELRTAFRVAGTEMSKDLDEALKSSADPVKTDAEQRATGILHVSAVDWSRMRVGITRHTVYVAPVEKGRRSRGEPKRRRPKVKTRLLERALEPALDANRSRAVQQLKDAVHDMAQAWGRV